MFEYIHLKYFCCDIVLLFLLITTTKESAGAPQFDTPADDTRHSVVQPIVHHGRSKREATCVKYTENMAGEHRKQVALTMDVDGQEYVLDLSLNEDLASRDYVISYQENGQSVQHKFTKEELDICQYSGTVRGMPGSWVVVSTYCGIRGIIHNGSTAMFIESDKEVIGQHILYNYWDRWITNVTYKRDNNNATENNVISPRLLKRHPSAILERGSRRFIRDDYNFERRYVQMMLVVDNSMYKDAGKCFDSVVDFCMTVVHIVSSMYAPLNIYISLEYIKIWNERDEIHIDDDPDITLQNFVEYRMTKLFPEFINDHALLLTHRNLNGSGTTGIFKGICEEAAVSMTPFVGVSSIVGHIAIVFAHILGLNVGIEGNTEDCNCHGDLCIMDVVYPNTSEPINQLQWSDCNKRDLADAYAKDKDYCLRNLPGSQCGNGRLDDDETCECGTAYDPYCAECCDIRTCTKINTFTCIWRGIKNFIIGQSFNDILGISFIGGICSNTAAGLTRKFSSVIGLVASIVAHELGHNLGMDHNNEDCDCNGEHCIMFPYYIHDIIRTQWSDCNKRELAETSAKNKDYCLR